MKTKSSIVVLALALFLTGSLWAQTTKTTKKSSTTTTTKTMHTRVATGSVVSASDTNLVISHRVKGKQEQMTFQLSPSTQKQGNLENGARVTVHYNTENGQNVATMVKASPTKASAKAKGAKS